MNYCPTCDSTTCLYPNQHSTRPAFEHMKVQHHPYLGDDPPPAQDEEDNEEES